MRKTRRVLITGGNGFLGRYVGFQFATMGYDVVSYPSSSFDLRNQQDVEKMFRFSFPDIVIHLAASVGGIGANQKNPGKFLYDNAVMGLEMMEQAAQYRVGKFVQVGTVCSYPKFCPVPFKEEDLWNGYPEETNAPYGLAKKLLLVQAQAYRQQFGLNAIYLIPTNLYGPGDNFDPETSHVIPALIKKLDKAIKNGDNEVEVWGTGTASREFLFVEDAAEGIFKATESYNSSEPVNLGTGKEVTIGELAQTLAHLMGYEGRLRWLTSKPDGQPRRVLNVERAKAFGFEAKTDLVDGLKRTIEWYQRSEKCV